MTYDDDTGFDKTYKNDSHTATAAHVASEPCSLPIH